MITDLTAEQARRLARADINPKEMTQHVLSAFRSEIQNAAICGHFSISADYSSMDKDQKHVADSIEQAAVVLRKQGFKVQIQGETGFCIDWEKPVKKGRRA